MQTILLAGGTGFIGSRLTEMLRAQGYAVRQLSRQPQGENAYFWNPATGEIDTAALQAVDAVINLAGAGIADKRWTMARKREIVESRVRSTELLCRHIAMLQIRPKAYLSASALGFYGNSGETLMREDSAPATIDFMAECCREWEDAVEQATALGLRVVKFRIGVVLAKDGGALLEIVKPLRFGLGVYFGNGRAWWPWIHRDDVCRAFIWALGDERISGTFNLSSPDLVRCKELVKKTAIARHQAAIFLPAPGWVMKTVFGEMSALLLNSNRVSSEKICAAGFQFQHPELLPALQSIFD